MIIWWRVQPHSSKLGCFSGHGLEAGLREVGGLLLRQVGALPLRQRPAPVHVRRAGQEQLEAELRDSGGRGQSQQGQSQDRFCQVSLNPILEMIISL